MNKRGMEFQGGAARYGGPEERNGPDDPPRQATAAQMAKRKIASLKGKPGGSQRGSRQASPAVGAPNAFNPTQAFQPPQSGAFSFSFGGDNVNPVPPFGQQPPQQQQNGGSGFAFGASAPAQSAMSTQQNGSGLFGGQNSSNTPSFGTSFGTSASQPQQNGFAPSTSSMFGQQNTTSTAPSNPFSFGQSTQPAQQNGFGPSGSNPFSFGASQPAPQEPRESTPAFGGFGASAQPKESTPSFGGFGASQPAAQPRKETTPAFGGLFGTSQPEQPAATASSTPAFGGFGKLAETDGNKPQSTFSFGATPTPVAPAAVKPGESVFSTLARPTINAGMFTQSKQNNEQTPKPSNLFGFSKPAEEAPKANNLFGLGTPAQTDGTKTASEETPTASNLLSTQPQSRKPESSFTLGASQPETPKPSNIFAGFQQTTTNGPSSFKPSLTEDTSMESPDNTPLKLNGSQSQIQSQSSLFSGSFATQTSTTSTGSQPSQAQTSAPKSQNLFDRLEKKDEPATVPKPTFSWGAPTPNPLEENQPPPEQRERDFFEHMGRPEPSTTKPKSISLTKALSAASSTPPTGSAPNAKALPAATAPTGSFAAFTGTSTSTPGQQFKATNQGFLDFLKSADLIMDWSPYVSFYVAEATKIKNKALSSSSNAPANIFASAASVSSAPNHTDDDATPKAPAFTNMFQNQTPSNNMIKSAQPPATAPVSKKRAADDDLIKSTEVPATEKRARANEPTEYPKLSDNASKSAKLFESVLDKAAPSSQKFGPPDDVVAKVRENAAKKADTDKSSAPINGFMPSTSSLFSGGAKSSPPAAAKDAEKPKVSFGFTPLKSKAPESEAPKVSFGFTPSASSAPSSDPTTFGAPASGSANFFSSFGKKAEANAEKEKKKKKMEEYDSEEDDEAEWEAKYQADQEEKKRKIAEAANGASGFGFKPASADFSAKPSSSLFKIGHGEPKKKASAETLEKEVGRGDKTWEPNTPLKFASSATGTSTTPAAAPPTFGGLFGSSTQTPAANKTDPDKLAPPALGFNFGPKAASLGTSRATTPSGVTTGGETSTNADDGEPSDAQNDKQIEDMTDLLHAELEQNEVLFQIDYCRASKFGPRADGQSGNVWVERGKGPLYILKDKTSGSVRVVVKMAPLGRQVMNFHVMKAPSLYKVAKERGKMVLGPFVDTSPGTSGGVQETKPSSWAMNVGGPDEAVELAKVLMENVKQ